MDGGVVEQRRRGGGGEGNSLGWDKQRRECMDLTKINLCVFIKPQALQLANGSHAVVRNHTGRLSPSPSILSLTLNLNQDLIVLAV